MRDFGAVFAPAKKRGGISFQKIADACDIKAQRVGELAKGQGEVTSLGKIEQIADAMRIPGEMIGLAPRSWERSSKPTVITGTVIPAQQTTEETRPQAEIGLSYARSLTDTLATVASLGSSDVQRRSLLTSFTRQAVPRVKNDDFHCGLVGHVAAQGTISCRIEGARTARSAQPENAATRRPSPWGRCRGDVLGEPAGRVSAWYSPTA
ncbi:hypothetical protein [Yinghuangia sp. YIM S10712]|uniref:hypothetical protein n=1 Tax=Yinghuangia sp. YIM S10712 TaxID=3436930 RepID=UPI003F534C8F